MKREDLGEFLNEMFYRFHNTQFIESDPISIPHRFERKEDIEISAFLSATIAWGNRTAILKGATEMMRLMDGSPYDFILNHNPEERERFRSFVYRTFNGEDMVYYLQALQYIYRECGGLEQLFSDGFSKYGTIKETISYARTQFFSVADTDRTTKHFANTEKNSAAKRINMFLRWMVRDNSEGVDFGLWSRIPTSELMMPLDVHSGNVGRKLGLLSRKQNDWKAVDELTTSLREFDANDPVKYDYALFGLGVFDGVK